MSDHTYSTHLRWEGSTGAGVAGYAREHVAAAPPAGEVPLSADPAFRGTAGRLNPEQLVVMAASSCQLLSFLAVAARAGVDVLAYVDDATSHLDLAAAPPRLATVRLATTVTVAAGTDAARVRHLAERAHRECFVAASLAVPVEVTTRVRYA
ncbi:OsmC family protein [Cellulomonas wangsupingiae]|uniref:OsmC family protein n=1 Tax=Cellulomonas wangsupingiae TaxID=2968085 RepID=A0ABY5K8Z0_9CELL|nr:OsmC family protein [Cellulomonas wangsupingiae]MCC2333099.1 OsmC family protein [Cellulomonas wangsupingiae]UUI66815.1 OsmC family protein [Cellulomonas wangsupingiae]